MIHNVRAVVEEALKTYGFEVEVEDEHPCDVSDTLVLEYVRARKPTGKVTIHMIHWTWGSDRRKEVQGE